jgi:hypothetical protein
MIDYDNYVIDFDRVNELTTSDRLDNNPLGSNYSTEGRVITYSITKQILKDYIQVYRRLTEPNVRKTNEENIDKIFNVLCYNKVLVEYNHLSHKRQENIDEVLED